MQKLLCDIWSILKAFGDWWLIWTVGPDGIIFDLLSIFKILISGAALIILLYRVIKNLVEWQ